MTTWMSVGLSRYRGDVFGAEQFMEQAAARQVLSLIAFIATLPGCRRLTVNEGRRTRVRQRTLRQRYESYLRGGPYAPLAAVLFTSRHDEVNHGNAADLGGPDGQVLNAAEVAAIRKYGPDFGVSFTGLSFVPPEPWHVEADGRTPIPDYAFASGDATPFPESEEDELTPEEKNQLRFLYEVFSAKGPVNGGVPLVDQIGGAFRDSAGSLAAAKAAAADAQFVKEVLSQPGPVNGNRPLADKIDGSVKVLDELRLHLIDESEAGQAKRGGRLALSYMVRNSFEGIFGKGPSLPNGNIVSMLGRLLKKTNA